MGSEIEDMDMEYESWKSISDESREFKRVIYLMIIVGASSVNLIMDDKIFVRNW